jgi:hypothetical protein
MLHNTWSTGSRPEKRDALLPALEHLQRALAAPVAGHEREWPRGMEDALGRMERALQQHAVATQGPDGTIALVDETRATLARKSEELRHEHGELLENVRALREEVRCAVEAPRPDGGTVRRRGEQLLADLSRHQQAETDLVQESINTDIGVGD